MALEQCQALERLGVPNAQRVVFARRHHVSAFLVALSVPDRTPVALVLAAALEQLRLILNRGIEVQDLRLVVLSADHEVVVGAGE